MTGTVPRKTRPKLPPAWHVPEDPKLWITWEHAKSKLEKEEVFWVSTTTKEGRPHAAPVWGIWKDGVFYFETDPRSVKGRNLLANPAVIVHLQDGLDTVIVEGKASRLRKGAAMEALATEYARKYDYTPDWSDPRRQVVFAVEPRVAHAWRAPRMHRTMVNFHF